MIYTSYRLLFKVKLEASIKKILFTIQGFEESSNVIYKMNFKVIYFLPDYFKILQTIDPEFAKKLKTCSFRKLSHTVH